MKQLSMLKEKRQSTANISCDNVYRYDLFRWWNWCSADSSFCMFIGLNPSTATAEIDDPTLQRCVSFAKKFDCSGLCMVNLFAYRSTYPAKLYSVEDPIGPMNNETIRKNAREAKFIVAAWGTQGSKIVKGRDTEVLELLSKYHVLCLGKNKDGSPKHPLYLHRDTVPETYKDAIL